MVVPAQAEQAAQLPPTAVLPRLRREPSIESIANALEYLSCLFAPRPADWPVELRDALEAASADHTERAYVMDWLTRLLASELAWVEEGPKRTAVMERTAQLLTGCTSALEAGEIVREFAFPMNQATPTLSLTVRDAPLPPSDAHSRQGAKEAAAAVGVQTYASSVIMCDLLVSQPGTFHPALDGSRAPSTKPFTIVELGAGTGIVGMIAVKLMALRDFASEVYITDYHDDVMTNLRYNLDTHLLNEPTPNVRVVCEALDWRTVHALLHPEAATEGVSASLLLAADVVYDPMHATWLLAAIKYLLRQPDTDPDARAHILVPVRSAGRLAGLYRTIDDAIDAEATPYHGYVLCTRSKRTLPRR
ncbi:hypothetical protein MBRA1_000587 [Malassezia brasiliensis]|uniref:Uncharacterized protein n=1 Tax=Malassezia brasiliensis TaxID=1821822 RepID=A0AAF0INQ5_9BASI|nr:hypothetical protein MBRA1_000587 [Malassezia brasiliensis]